VLKGWGGILTAGMTGAGGVEGKRCTPGALREPDDGGLMNDKASSFQSVLFFSDVPWEGITQRPHHLASGLASRWPVLWVEPLTLGHSRHLRVRTVGDNLHAVGVPLFPLNARQQYVQRLARVLGDRAVARRGELFLQERMLRAAMRRCGLASTRYALLIQNFQLIRLAGRLSPVKTLFDYIDDAFGFTEYPAWVAEEWRMAVRASDVVTVTSSVLQAQIVDQEPGRSGRVHRVPNGVEFSRFAGSSGASRPADLPRDSRPIVGYVGSIYPWIDFELLEHLACQLPDAWLVLVGPAHPKVRESLSRLARLPNVRVLGVRPYESVPAYVRAFDVGIVPFRKTRLTAAVNPVKLYEYSAAGVPTVCTDFAADLKEMGALIHTAHDRGEFTRSVRASMLERRDRGRVAELQEFARRNDWEERIARIASLLVD
jgi:glycosyltransferase involved in cell wall biosynthesis